MSNKKKGGVLPPISGMAGLRMQEAMQKATRSKQMPVPSAPPLPSPMPRSIPSPSEVPMPRFSYKGGSYVIHTGKRGGKYIIVNGTKRYIPA